MSKRNEENARPTSRRALAAAVLAIFAAACPPPLYADDDSDQTSQQVLVLLKQWQTLQGANNDQALMQDGFALGETFSTVTGQPEIAVGIKLLQGVLDFTGAFSSSSSSSAETQLQTTLTKNVAEMKTQIANLQQTVNVLTGYVVSDHNQAMTTALFAAHQYFSDQKDTLYPASTLPSGSPQKGVPRRVSGGAAAEPADRLTASRVATEVARQLDLFIQNEDQYFLGDDVQTVAGTKRPAPGLKPYPALTTYLFGMQLWITATEIESGGTDSGRAQIRNDPNIQRWLTRHIAFLRSKANGGADPNYPLPIQDRIVAAQHCVWNINGQIGSSTSYSDKQGTCSAYLSCQDGIARMKPRVAPTTITWKQQPNSYCTLSANGDQALSNGGVASDLLNPVERTLEQQYGLAAMNRMAAMLAQIAHLGTAMTGPAATQVGNFGGKSDAAFFVYGVDGSGAVKSYTGYRNQPLPQPGVAGNIANVKALIPGGGTTFYALTKDGKLNWYQFNTTKGSKSFNGPVTVSSGFGAYKQVFGGGDGVIYAVQNDGTLLWFRHGAFANGSSSTLTGPKAVASGFGQFKSVFSAGDGIIYAVATDGSLLWYRHKGYLTGVADAPAQSAPNTKPSPLKAGPNFAGPSQLEGPVNVNAGWGNFSEVIPSGDGVLLAVQADGKLLWYRHTDYLTGISSGAPSGGGIQKNTTRPTGWEAQAGAEHAIPSVANAANRPSSTAPSWGAPAQAQAGSAPGTSMQRTAMGAPQWGTPAQAHPVAGTTVAPSALHESAGSLHPPSSVQTAGSAGAGIGAHQAVGTGSALGAAASTSHWDGPATIDAHSGWEALAGVAAMLPLTTQTNVIK